MFQSTHPHGVRLPYVGVHPRWSSFNPRTRTGCDSRSVSSVVTQPMFQSTHPHGVRRLTSHIWAFSTTFQSTHPHGVRLYILGGHEVVFLVSIHAPARGATKTTSATIRVRLRFNPRTRTGCDVSFAAAAVNASVFQSTHPHGVRRRSREPWESPRGFNPRTRTGCDVSRQDVTPHGSRFQSTHPHGVRRKDGQSKQAGQ